DGGMCHDRTLPATVLAVATAWANDDASCLLRVVRVVSSGYPVFSYPPKLAVKGSARIGSLGPKQSFMHCNKGTHGRYQRYPDLSCRCRDLSITVASF